MNTPIENQNGLLDKYWKQIIRPPRKLYKISELGFWFPLLIFQGPTTFILSGIVVKRTDFQVTTKRNFMLQDSYFQTSQGLPIHIVNKISKWKRK
jgi:hypothetical protein